MNKSVHPTQIKQNLKDEFVQAAYPEFTPKIIQHLAPPPSYLNVRQFSERNPVFTEAALRNLIFKANSRKSSIGVIEGNGLIETGAIVRLGRKVLIKEDKFFNWLESQQQ